MGKTYDAIDERLTRFIERQSVFFVATAPLASAGHVNLSPKGLRSLAVLGPRRVGYVDLVGSGVETVAHVRENGRIAFLFCSFEGPPMTLRLHGRARVLEPGDAEFEELSPRFESYPNTRSLVVADIERIADSCGYGVPLLRFEGERTQLGAWADRKGDQGVRSYQLENNLESLDGLPGLRAERLREE